MEREVMEFEISFRPDFCWCFFVVVVVDLGL